MALLSGNRAEAWCAGVAAQAFGLTVTWLHPLAPAEDHAHQLNDAGADVLLVDVRRFAECGGALAAHVGGLRVVFTVGPADYGTDLLREAEHVGPSMARDVATPEGIASLSLAPPLIYALLDDPALRTADLASLELLLYGASAITPDRLAEGLDRIGGVFSQFYGQTECYPISLLRRTEHDPERPELLTSAGQPVTASTVAILDDEGNEVSTGNTGEICVRSPLAMNGYHRRPGLTEEVFAHGWLHTGDIGRVDDRGYVFIVDRKKDMIIRNGVNVFSRGVENALSEHPAVSQAAVFGTPDAVTGEAVNSSHRQFSCSISLGRTTHGPWPSIFERFSGTAESIVAQSGRHLITCPGGGTQAVPPVGPTTNRLPSTASPLVSPTFEPLARRWTGRPGQSPGRDLAVGEDRGRARCRRNHSTGRLSTER
ncbi:hypothetical protein ADL25_19320 [Streptomyces sp. NRRL F-5122]|nr:hypothetical protein ADL25_19320 [Streptomyces sp. NRRL F-5122]